MNKYKLFMIISIIILILSITGTIAFFSWKADDESSINVTVAGGNGSCSVKEDNSVFLEPTLTKNGGRIITLKAKQDLASKAVISWNMVINEIEGLSDKSFKYEMINNLTGASYGSGNFENITEGSTITFSNTNEVLALGTEYEFTLYLWIDGNVGNNPLSMANQTLDFDIQCNLTSTDTGTYIGTNMLMIVDSSLGKADTEVFLRRNEEGEGLLRNQVESVTFVENIEVPEGNTSIDVSYNEDDSVIMWYGNPNSSGYYDVYIGGKNGDTIIRDGAQLFAYLTNAKTINFNNAVDTTNMNSMLKMFNFCTNVTSIDFSGLITSNVTDMAATFQRCEKIVSLDLNNWDTINVKLMNHMFNKCTNLTNLVFDKDKWNSSNVTNMNHMFQMCTSFTELDLSGFDVSNATDLSYIFNRCSSLTSLDVSNFNTGKVTDMSFMFGYCTNLTSLDVSNWNTSNVTTMECMFYNCLGLTTLDVSNWNTSNVNIMSDMFNNCSKLTILDLSDWDTGGVTAMNGMFYGCTKLTTIYVSNKWSTSTVEASLSNFMFTDCTSLVGGSGTTYSASKVNAQYAKIDGGTSSPGYFTYKAATT